MVPCFPPCFSAISRLLFPFSSAESPRINHQMSASSSSGDQQERFGETVGFWIVFECNNLIFMFRKPKIHAGSQRTVPSESSHFCPAINWRMRVWFAALGTLWSPDPARRNIRSVNCMPSNSPPILNFLSALIAIDGSRWSHSRSTSAIGKSELLQLTCF